MSAVLARHDNVVDVDFSGPASPPPEAGSEDSSWWPWAEEADVETASGKTPAATRPVPARLSPRPLRVARRRFARSQLAADLREYAWLVGLLIGAVCASHLHDHLNALTGGPR